MTCRVLVIAPGGSSMEVRALLDNGSSASFVSERLVQSLGLPHIHQNIRVSDIAGSLRGARGVPTDDSLKAGLAHDF